MSFYCLVIDNKIISEPMSLPACYKNISNFYCLSDQEVLDLSWSGNPGEGFWPATIGPVCDYTINQKMVKKSELNIFNKTVSYTYIAVELSTQEYESRINFLKNQIRTIRDNYLKLTDFTQLPDAPISTTAKADFSLFRQQLRDVLNNVSDPTTITWPTIPTSAPNIEIPPFPPVPTYKNGLTPPV
jgi:hypothetical protein